ncbi:MAG: hypothetical protein M3150_05375, partial [Pseudomonadota bacterium]|nr:hypothetical protein [Pseudomonadota bacterium]
FHFFWVTLLWPWVVATGLVLARNRHWLPARAVAPWLLCAASIFMMLWGGALAHLEHHRMEASYRLPTVTCLMSQLQQGDGIDCHEFNMPDLTPAYIYAKRIGASFVRYFPILPLKIGVDDPAPWFRMSRDPGHVAARDLSRGPAGYQAGSDAQFLIHTGRPGEMANCVMLDVTAVLSAERDDTVQVFFRRFGEAEFSEANSRVLPLRGHAGLATFAFQVESDTGFDDMLRLDPVNTAQPFVLTDVEVRCRLRYSTRPFFVLKQPPDRFVSGQTPQLVDSAWLDPVAGDPYGYRAGIDAQVTFKTDKPLQMALCGVLHMEAKIAARKKGLAQVYFLARGKKEFSEASSVTVPVVPARDGEAQALLFRLESRTGFEDKVRFDPIDTAQDIRIFDVKLSCQRRVGSTLARPVPAGAAGKPEKS